MTDSNLTLEKDSSQEEELYSFEGLYKNMPADIYANTSSSLDWNQLVNKEDSINRFYLNDNDEAYVDENNNNALRQVAGISTEIGTGIATDYATAPLLLGGPLGWGAYGVINFGSGYSSNVAAQKIRGEKDFSYGEAIAAGFFQMIPYGSTGKGVKGLVGAGLQGATTATGELTVRTAIDEKRLPTKEEYAVSGTIGTVFGTGFKGTLDGLSSIYKKYNGKSAAEIDKVITKKEKNLIDKLLTDTADIVHAADDKLDDLGDEIIPNVPLTQRQIRDRLADFDIEQAKIAKKLSQIGPSIEDARKLGKQEEFRELAQRNFDIGNERTLLKKQQATAPTGKIAERLRQNLKNVAASDAKALRETDQVLKDATKTTGRQKILPGTPHPTDAKKVRGYDGRWVTKKHFKQVTESRKGANEIRAQFDQPVKEVAELSQDKAIDLRLFKEGKYDVYRDGPVVVERIPEDPSLMPSINVKAIEDLGDIELKEFGLTKKEFSNLSTQKKVSLLKNSFERTREVLPPGKYELFGSTEKKRSIYARWFKNDPDIEWLDIETNKPAKPSKDSYAVLIVKDQKPPISQGDGPLEGTSITPHQVNPEQVSNTSEQFNFIVNRIKQLKEEGAFSSVKTTEDTIDGGIRMLANTNKLKSHAQMYAKIYGLVPTDELNYALAEAVTLSTQKTADINQKLIDAINVSKDPVLIEQNINEIIESIGEIDEWLRLGIPLRTEQGRGLRSMQIPTQGVSPEEFAKMTPAEKYKLNRTGQTNISIKESEQSLKLEELKTNLLDAFEVAKQTGDYTALNKLTNTIKRPDGNVEKISALYETTLLHKTLSSFNKANRIFNEIGINALLSAPTTNEINFLSGVLETYMSSYELIRGAGSRVELDAAIRHLIALKSNTSFARKAFTQSFKTSDNWINRGALKADYQEKFVISSEGKDILSRVYDGSGKVIRFPSQLMTSVDALVQAPNLIASIHYQGHIEGVKLGYKGKDLDNYIKGHLDAILEYYASNSGKGIKDKVTARILKRSQEFAKRSTFTEDIRADGYWDFGHAAKFINSAANQIPMVRTLLSFIRAPTNIIKRQLRRTPVLNKALKELAVDLESTDPIVRNQARGQMKVAKDLGLTVAALTGAGILMQQDPNFVPPVILTGGGPNWKTKEGRAVWKSMLKNGWLPYSVGHLQKNEVGQPLIGDDGKPVYKYYSYERLDPLSTWIGLMVDFSVSNGYLTDDEYDDFTVGWMGAFTRNLFDRSYLQQVDDAMKAFSDERGGTEREKFWSQQLASRFFLGNFTRYAKQLPGDLLDMVGVSKEDSARFHQKRDTRLRAGDKLFGRFDVSGKDEVEGASELRSLLNRYSETVPGMGGNLPFLHEHITNEPILYPQRPGPDLFSWIKTSTSKNHPLWTALGTIGKELREPSDVITGSASSKRVEPFRLTTTEYAELKEIVNTIESRDGKNIDQTIREYLKSDHYKKNIALVKKNGALNEVIGVNEIYSKLQEINNAYISAGEEEWIKKQGGERQQEQINKKKGIIDKYIEEIKALPN